MSSCHVSCFKKDTTITLVAFASMVNRGTLESAKKPYPRTQTALGRWRNESQVAAKWGS
jgi:hypothetical protein